MFEQFMSAATGTDFRDDNDYLFFLSLAPLTKGVTKQLDRVISGVFLSAPRYIQRGQNMIQNLFYR